MDISDTRKCNLFNFEMLARFMGAPEHLLIGFYEELLNDHDFLASINNRIAEIREKWGFNKGIFAMPSIDSIDWFAFERVLIYVLIRYLKPNRVLETGVYYGGNTAFALQALARNQGGKLVSIDYPDSEIRLKGSSEARHSLVGDSELYEPRLRPGFMVPLSLYEHWELIEGDSLKVIPDLQDTFDLYIHDSDHSMPFLSRELAAAWEKLSNRALVLVDDIDWSNAFFAFCVKQRLFPLLMTDNGKDNLRVRTGIALRGHANNGNDLFT
jgi:hypothetical protein